MVRRLVSTFDRQTRYNHHVGHPRRQIQSSPPVSPTSRHIPLSSIGRGALDPVDLTLLDADLDAKESGDEREQSGFRSRPASALDIKVEAPDNQYDMEAKPQILAQEPGNAVLPEQASISEPLTLPTGPRRRPDHDYRYVRVDCPASLQLHRVPVMKTRHSYHGPYPRSVSKRSIQINSLHSGRRHLEDQSQLFRAAMMSRPYEDLSVPASIDWPRDARKEDVIMQDRSKPLAVASMDDIVTSEVVLSPVRGESQPPSSQVVTNDVLLLEDERVPSIPPDEDTNMVVYSEEATSVSSSDSEHDRPTKPQSSETLLDADSRRTLDLLASINHTVIKEILEEESSPLIAPSREINGSTKAIRSQPLTSRPLKSGNSVERRRVAQSALSTDGKVKSVPREVPRKPKVFINYGVSQLLHHCSRY